MKKQQKFIITALILVSILLTFSIRLIFQTETENFETFNRKFHSDSIFQMSRIKFPLKGQLIDGFENHNWNSKTWHLMTTEVGSKNLPKEFKRKITKTDSSVVESIWIENSGFKLEREFKPINNQWFLTSYNEVNL